MAIIANGRNASFASEPQRVWFERLRDKGWTVPMAMGKEPYCDVYVVGDEGVFRYDWKAHALKQISAAKVKGDLGGHWSVWVNGNWRVAFRFAESDVELVDYQDYHGPGGGQHGDEDTGTSRRDPA